MPEITMLDFLDENGGAEPVNIDAEDLQKAVMDLSLSQETRIDALERYCELHGDDAVELFSSFTGMYQFSGISILQSFLYHICTHGQMSPFLRLEAAQSLLSYEEDEFYEEDDEELEDEAAVERNKERLALGYKALDHVCYDLTDPTPRRVEAVCTLMESAAHKVVANAYFRELVNDQDLDCDYRYKIILSLESKDKIVDKEFFIRKACLEFLFTEENKTLVRILAAQNLMELGGLDDAKVDKVCKTVLVFAQDKTLSNNLRADATDVLLGLAPEKMQKAALKVLAELASAYGHVRSVFDNAQNVHTAEIDESLNEGLKALAEIPMMEIDRQPITFDYVRAQVMELVKVEKVGEMGETGEGRCRACGSEDIEQDTETCCVKCEENWKCVVSLNRINMDRKRYSALNFTLSHILLRVWSFIDCNEYKETLERRLVEELCDMCGTCSTGFAARLVNVMSGFGGFSMRVSWEDQITANFVGRLNAFARRIEEPDSLFRTEKLDEVIELWLNRHPDVRETLKTHQEFERERRAKEEDQEEALAERKREQRRREKAGDDTAIEEVVENKVRATTNVRGLMKDMVAEFKNGPSERIDTCVEEFAENVLNEMTIVTSDWAGRPNFLLFFGSVMLRIREEMYQEFREHMDDSDFDLYMRKAIIVFEGAT